MYKLALILALVTLTAGADLDTSERIHAAHAPHAPKCYLSYKKCCSYKKAVYGKCHKQACHKVKKCRIVYHAAVPDATATPALDASVKQIIVGHHQTHHGRHAKQQCWYENQCKLQTYDCVKSYVEAFRCEHEKKKHGSFLGW